MKGDPAVRERGRTQFRYYEYENVIQKRWSYGSLVHDRRTTTEQTSGVRRSADSIEHGNFVTDEQLRQMRDRICSYGILQSHIVSPFGSL